MSIESVAPSSCVPAVVTRDPRLSEALDIARAINKRPHHDYPERDTKFVSDYLSHDADVAKKKYRKLAQLLHQDVVTAHGGTPADIAECEAAFKHLSICYNALKKPAVPAAQNPGFASVIIVAASVAERGLAMADEGLKAAHAAWQRKVDDGTVDAVKARASDLFDMGRSLAQRGWAEAIRRTRGKS